VKKPLSRLGASLSAGIGFLAVAALAFLQADIRWPWLRTAAILISVTGLGLALLPARVRGPWRLAGLLLTVLGWYLLAHADPHFDGLPGSPFLARFFDLPPALGPSIAGAGFLLVGATETIRAGRRALLAGALLMLASCLMPVTRLGDLQIPLLAALQHPTGKSLPAIELFLAAVAVLWWLRVPRETDRRLLLGARAVMALLLPLLPTLVNGTVAASYVILGEQELVLVATYCLAESPDEAHSLEWIAVGAIALLWWLLRIHGLGYAATDEYIYFYAARLWSEGTTPYRDFFFSHPPLHLALPALLFKLVGFRHLLAKLFAPVTMFLAGLVLWRGARRHFDGLTAVLSLAFFWFGMEVLRASTTFTGVELTTLFLVLGLVAALDRRSFVAGLWFGASACAGVYGVAGFLTFVVLALFAPKRTEGRWRWDSLQLLAGFCAVFVTLNVLFIVMDGQPYIDGVYRYHLLKAEKNAAQHPLSANPLELLYNLVVLFQGRDFRVSLYYQTAHYWLALLAVVALVLKPDGVTPDPRSWWTHRRGIVALLTLHALGVLTELGSLQERYDYYFTLLFPSVSLLAGFAVAELLRALDRLTLPESWLRSRWPTPAVGVALAILWVPLAAWANGTAFPDEIHARGSSQGAGEQLQFEWTPSPVLPELGEIAHALFWSDTRIRGEIQSGISHYLWSKKRFFQTAPEIAAYVDAHTTPEDSITGASDYAPLIALLSQRRLSGNEIDTNSKVFTTGIQREGDFWDKVCADRPAYIVSANASFFAPQDLPRRQEGDAFRREITFEDHGIKQFRPFPIELWRRVREPPEKICGL
jgi:hypothetical protein